MDPTLTTPSMHYWRMAPDPRLRPHVLCYFFAVPRAGVTPGLGLSGAAFAEEELLLPDGHSEVVFQLGGTFERRPLGDAAHRQVMRQSYVIGSRSHSVLTRDLGPVTVAGIKLDPRALRQLLGVPVSALRESTFTFDELRQRALLELEDAVAAAAARAAQSRGPSGRDVSARDVSALFDRHLLRALARLPPADAAVEQLLRHIRSRHGALSIMDWAQQRRIDARHLERRFTEAIGMTPKRYARIIRFKHGYHALLSGAAEPSAPRQPLPAPHRYLEGFYDQSHFNKEFKAFIGAAPSARLRATLRQATDITDHLLAGELAGG